jgi:surface antigen
MRAFIWASTLVLLSSCGNSQAMKTVGTLAGSSAGSAVGQAINASGPWGYVASIATTTAGGFAGNMVTKLFLPNTEKAVRSNLIEALNTPETGKILTWGTAKNPQMGIVATTGDVFAAASGASCRAFRITNGMPAVIAAPPAPDAMAQVDAANEKVGAAAGAAEKVSSLGGDATKDVSDGAGTVGDASKKLGQATSILGGGKNKVSEAYGTACKNAKGEWVTVKA